ncbi:MAG: fatty acid desaturase [Ferruginibacter sp.]
MPVVEEKIIHDYSLLGAESIKAKEQGLVEAEWYRSPIATENMRKLLIRKDGLAIRDTIIWFGLMIGSGFLVFLWWGSWWAILPYIVYSVLYASTSDSRWHESGHGTAFKTDWMNNALYEISSFMVFRQSTVWRWSHARHHSDTIIRGSDPEISIKRPTALKQLLLVFFGIAAVSEMRKLVIHASGRIEAEVATYVPKTEHPKVILKARIYLAIFLLVIALCFVFKTILPLMFIGLPTLFGSWLMPVYGFTQHAGLDENVLDHRLNSRTVYMNRVNRFLYWNMNYHIEHHMFPLVPYHALPRLHELMKDDCPKAYSGIIDAYKEIIPALIKQSKDPSYFVERKLPAKPVSDSSHLKKKFIGDEKKFINDTVEVCHISFLPKGGILRFDFREKTYAVYRTEEDKLFATDGTCTHGNAHLSDGIILGNVVECPKHNGRFALKTGMPKRLPACTAISTYSCFQVDEMICLKITTADEQNIPAKKCRVVSNINLTSNIKELVLQPLEKNFSYQPGQFIQLSIPPHSIQFRDIAIDTAFKKHWQQNNLFNCFAENMIHLKRNYSLVTNPATDSLLRFNVRIALSPDAKNISAGAGSSYVFNLKPGDQVNLFGPFGDFLIKETGREKVYIGGGVGMGPLRSHISHLLETMNSKQKISYWYGARTKEDLFYVDYFINLQELHPNFSFRVAFSDLTAEENTSVHKGFIADVVYKEYLQQHANLADIEFYLCGPPAMIQASLKMLETLQVPTEQIAFDEF